MIDTVLVLWFFVFVIILIVHLIADSSTWGMIGALWFMVLGLAILLTGVEMQTGVTITDTAVINTYESVVLPFSTYAYVWGIFIIGISMYMLLANAMKRTT